MKHQVLAAALALGAVLGGAQDGAISSRASARQEASAPSPSQVARSGLRAAPVPADVSPVRLSAEDVLFGQRQVDQMMLDRKNMGAYVSRGDSIYQWAARQFAGAAAGQRIYWSTNMDGMAEEYSARHSPPTATQKGYIAIRELHLTGPKKGQRLSGDELWMCAVFEFFNVSNDKGFVADYEAAKAGKFTRAGFIESNTRREFLAVSRCARFYRETWRPWAKQKRQPSDKHAWLDDAPTTYGAWIAQYKDPTSYPNSYWGKYYDDYIIPYRKYMDQQAAAKAASIQ